MQLHIATAGVQTSGHGRPLLFVHGAWHGSWCWEENFVPYFSKLGFACHTFDFRGHGQSEGKDSLNNYRISDYVEDLGDVVAGIKQTPVLIAHSMGGLVAQKYAQDHEVAGLALLAPVPISGVGYGYGRAHPVPFLKFLLTRKGKAMIDGDKLARSLFFSQGIPDDLFKRYYQELQDESYGALLDTGKGIEWKPLMGRPPLLIIEAGRDAVIPRGRLEATARMYGSETARLDDLAHDVMIDLGWVKAAEAVESWLDKNGL
jgi:pimeloyl-ACP methyl ester carboxylesterase